MPLSEHVYCVAVTFKMTDLIEWQICMKFCIKVEYSSTESIWMIQKATPMGNWWLAVHHYSAPTHASCLMQSFWQNIKTPRCLSPLQPRFGTQWLLAFPKTKITFEREEISEHWWDSGKSPGSWWWLRELYEVPRCLLWRRLRCHCSMYSISCILYLLQ